jgi:hypothetical protein
MDNMDNDDLEEMDDEGFSKEGVMDGGDEEDNFSEEDEEDNSADNDRDNDSDNDSGDDDDDHRVNAGQLSDDQINANAPKTVNLSHPKWGTQAPSSTALTFIPAQDPMVGFAHKIQIMFLTHTSLDTRISQTI